VGWGPGSVYGAPALDRCRRGVNLFWRLAFGLEHEAEFLPNTVEAFPVAWLPPGVSAPDADRPVVKLAEMTAHTLPPDLGRPVARPDLPLVWNNPRFLLAVNSSENIDREQPFAAVWRGLRVTGILPLHHLLLMYERNGDLCVLAVGTPRRATRFRIVPGPGVFAAPAAAGVRIDNDPEEQTVAVTCDHRRGPVLRFRLSLPNLSAGPGKQIAPQAPNVPRRHPNP